LRIVETSVAGVYLIEADIFPDARGQFVRGWVADELSARGLDTHVEQCSLATNTHRGTIRGMHLQTTPYDGAKTIRVTRGAVFDVAIDLRPDSPTFRRWFGVELADRRYTSLYVPAGCAHGYQTLVDDAEVLYFTAAPYAPAHQEGVRWDDPAFRVAWPVDPPTVVNDRDRSYPDFVSSRP
jgi:dTDP-4-dehydrorhamnose 3,5-epimerase